MIVGSVAQILRYPVKSMRGERLDACRVGPAGLEGDRRWALRVGEKVASGKSTRRFQAVIGLRAFPVGWDGEVPTVELDGDVVRLDDPAAGARLSAAVGTAVQPFQAADPAHDAAPVHLITTGELALLGRLAGEPAADPRRYRPNLVLTADARGDDWLGRRLRIGGAELAVTDPTERCAMVNQQEGAEVPAHPGLLRTLGAARDLCAGVYAEVVTAGAVAVGDAVELD